MSALAIACGRSAMWAVVQALSLCVLAVLLLLAATIAVTSLVVCGGISVLTLAVYLLLWLIGVID